MIVKIEWLNNGGGKGSMTVDISKFFPTTKLRAKKLFKVMTMDICGTDFKPVRDWLEEQRQAALKEKEAERYQSYIDSFDKIVSRKTAH